MWPRTSIDTRSICYYYKGAPFGPFAAHRSHYSRSFSLSLYFGPRKSIFFILSRVFYVISCGDNMVIQYLQRYFLQDKRQDMIQTRYGRIKAR